MALPPLPCKDLTTAPLPPRSPPLLSLTRLGESQSGSYARLSPGAELAAAVKRAEEETSETRQHGRSRESGLAGTAMLGRRSGGMRRCRGAQLAAMAAMLLVAVARAQVQQEPSLETTVGTGINITCSHPGAGISDWIHWYRQLPGRGPELFVLTAGGSKELSDGAGHLWVSSDRKSSALYLSQPRRGDSAVYYCALRDTGRGAAAAAGQEPPRAGPGGASRGRCRSSRRGLFARLVPSARGASDSDSNRDRDSDTVTVTVTGTPTVTVTLTLTPTPTPAVPTGSHRPYSAPPLIFPSCIISQA